MAGEPLRALLEQYGDTTYFLEQLIRGLKQKHKPGGWDKSFGVEEAKVAYVAGDADEAFEAPQRAELSEKPGDAGS